MLQENEKWEHQLNKSVYFRLRIKQVLYSIYKTIFHF